MLLTGIFAWFIIITEISNVVAQDESDCPAECGWHVDGTSCFWISSDVGSQASWDNALVVCQALQASLSTVTPLNHEFLKDEMRSRGTMHWLGFSKSGSKKESEFSYIDGSPENPELTFKDIGSDAKPSAESKLDDCAGISYTDTIEDIWWEDDSCDNEHYFICVRNDVNTTTETQTVSTTSTTTTSPGTDSTTTMTTTMTTTTQQPTTITTTSMTTTEEAIKSIGIYKPRKVQTAPPTNDPVSVISGTAAIVIILAVLAFIIGNDVLSIICNTACCAPKIRKSYEPQMISEDTSHVVRFQWKGNDFPREIDLLVRFQNHFCYAVKQNGKFMKATKLDTAYLVQTNQNLEIWIKHISVNMSGHSDKRSLYSSQSQIRSPPSPSDLCDEGEITHEDLECTDLTESEECYIKHVVNEKTVGFEHLNEDDNENQRCFLSGIYGAEENILQHLTSIDKPENQSLFVKATQSARQPLLDAEEPIATKEKLSVDGDYTSSTFSTAALIGPHRTNDTSFGTFHKDDIGEPKNHEGNTDINHEPTGETLMKVLNSVTEEPIKAVYVSSKPTTYHHQNQRPKKIPDLVPDAPTAVYIKSVKIKQPNLKEGSSESGFGDGTMSDVSL